MNFIKKFLPLLLVAIVFAVGGYFVGSGMNNNQGAALYKGVANQPKSLVGTGTVITVSQTTLAECEAMGKLLGVRSWYDAPNGQCHLYNLASQNKTTISNTIDKEVCEKIPGKWVFNKNTHQNECIFLAGNTGAPSAQ